MAEPPAAPTTKAPFRIWLPLGVIAAVGVGLTAFYVTRPSARPAPRDLAQEARADLEQRHFRPLSASLEATLADANYEPIPTQTSNLLLQSAPDFSLPDIEGNEWSLATHLQQGPVLLVFYFGYHCNHCVSQLFALDKDLAKFRELGVQVAAISADPPELTRERYHKYGVFGFPVLSDPDNKVARLYETYLPHPTPGQEGDALHGTFVIARGGKIVWVNRGDAPFTENQTLLYEVARAERRFAGKRR
jgi:thioredoxin-dependent peroxiredoxin